MNDPVPPVPPAPSARKLIIGSLSVMAIAAVALVVFILPAEYGVDPTGAGRALGVTKLAEPGLNEEQIRGAKRTGVLTLSDTPIERETWRDTWEFELAPYEAIEFKYTLAEGEAMDFAWEAPVVLEYDMHSHPFEGGEELTESYSVDEAQHMQGRYVAAFSGLHGWYWQNRTLEPVTLTLKADGRFTESTVWEGGIPRKRAIPAAE